MPREMSSWLRQDPFDAETVSNTFVFLEVVQQFLYQGKGIELFQPFCPTIYKCGRPLFNIHSIFQRSLRRHSCSWSISVVMPSSRPSFSVPCIPNRDRPVHSMVWRDNALLLNCVPHTSLLVLPIVRRMSIPHVVFVSLSLDLFL